MSKSGQVNNCKQIKEIYNLQEKNQPSPNVIVGTICSVYIYIKNEERKTLGNLKICSI